jgi:hypothetical protein
MAVQLVGEEHQHPVYPDLFVMAVQLGDEEHLPPVHLDLFGVAVQLGDQEHQHPVHLYLFENLRLLLEPVAFHCLANGPIYVVDESQVLPVHFLVNPMYKNNLRKEYEKIKSLYLVVRFKRHRRHHQKLIKELLCFD